MVAGLAAVFHVFSAVRLFNLIQIMEARMEGNVVAQLRPE